MIPADARAALNYGPRQGALPRAGARAGARIRNRVVLLKVEAKERGRALLTLHNTIEIEGEVKPALVAELLALLTGRQEQG